MEDTLNTGGRPPYPTEVMVRVLVVKHLHGLPDEQTEFHLLDRCSFQRFIGLEHSIFPTTLDPELREPHWCGWCSRAFCGDGSRDPSPGPELQQSRVKPYSETNKSSSISLTRGACDFSSICCTMIRLFISALIAEARASKKVS